MSSSKKNENWLLVELGSGSRDVVYVRAVVNPMNKELKVGDVMTVNRRGQQQTATLVARAREREPLEQMLKKEDPGPSAQPEEEPKDYSSSASSWVPSDEDGAQSGDSAEVKHKRVKLEPCRRQYSNRRTSKKIITPSHRANAVIPKIMQQPIYLASRKRPHTPHALNLSINKSLPDSTKKNNIQNVAAQKVSIDVRELLNIKHSFQILFKMLEDMKNPGHSQIIPEVPAMAETVVEIPKTNISVNETFNETPMLNAEEMQSYEEYKENENCQSDEFNRSDDNVLITNKYNAVKTVQVNGNQNAKDKEWVPIGSGKTLIHKDQFRKVNWRSYTIATRTLLLAVFPRRILATHSLTGKRSPAFQDKPAKMCLDPKIISDVIMEIMDRFNVKENLVRGIITTKCADECKMWKTRVNKKKSRNHEDLKKTVKNNGTRSEHVA